MLTGTIGNESRGAAGALMTESALQQEALVRIESQCGDSISTEATSQVMRTSNAFEGLKAVEGNVMVNSEVSTSRQMAFWD